MLAHSAVDSFILDVIMEYQDLVRTDMPMAHDLHPKTSSTKHSYELNAMPEIIVVCLQPLTGVQLYARVCLRTSTRTSAC